LYAAVKSREVTKNVIYSGDREPMFDCYFLNLSVIKTCSLDFFLANMTDAPKGETNGYINPLDSKS
jgi:hypothetical protein